MPLHRVEDTARLVRWFNVFRPPYAALCICRLSLHPDILQMLGRSPVSYNRHLFLIETLSNRLVFLGFGKAIESVGNILWAGNHTRLSFLFKLSEQFSL